MNSDEWLRLSSRMPVDYCVFDHDYQKPTDFGHSFGEGYQANGITGDGKCHQNVEKGGTKSMGDLHTGKDTPALQDLRCLDLTKCFKNGRYRTICVQK